MASELNSSNSKKPGLGSVGARQQSLSFAETLLANTRRRWLVNPRLQLRMVGYSALIVALTLATTYLASTYVFDQSYQAMRGAGVSLSNPMYGYLEVQRSVMAVIFVVASAVSVVAGAIVALVMSHRVAGPIYRMEQHLLQAAAGRAPRAVQFRKKDYFQELAAAYNEELRTRGRIRRVGTEENRSEREDELRKKEAQKETSESDALAA